MERPLSSFMFPTWYRFQMTSALSILLAWWLVAAAVGGEVFAATQAVIASPVG